MTTCAEGVTTRVDRWIVGLVELKLSQSLFCHALAAIRSHGAGVGPEFALVVALD